MKKTKSITIGFSRPKAWYAQPTSWLIRNIEGCDYSHVYIKISSNNLTEDIYYHASGLSIKFLSKDLFTAQNHVIEERSIPISDHRYYKTLDFAIAHTGKPFSIKQLFGMAIVKFMAVFGKEIKNPLGKNGYICTELVAHLLATVYKRTITKDLNSITLKDIRNIIEN